jgi:hypothetical protein
MAQEFAKLQGKWWCYSEATERTLSLRCMWVRQYKKLNSIGTDNLTWSSYIDINDQGVQGRNRKKIDGTTDWSLLGKQEYL